MYTVLSKDYCPWCTKACELLLEQGETYNVVELSKRPGFNSAMRTLAIKAGFTSVPQVFAPDGTYIGGYDELKAYLNN